MESGYSLSDLAAATRNNEDGWGNGGAWWIIIFVLFMWGRGGWGFGEGGGQPVTEAGLCNAMNFNDLENQVGRMADQQQNIARQTDNAICNLGYTQLQLANDTQRQLAECYCTTQRAIDGVNYNVATQASAIMQTDTQNTQKILDKLCELNTRSLQNRVNQLELQAQMQGVVRYPNGFVYSAGNSPFCGCNPCGCGTNF